MFSTDLLSDIYKDTYTHIHIYTYIHVHKYQHKLCPYIHDNYFFVTNTKQIGKQLRNHTYKNTHSINRTHTRKILSSAYPHIGNHFVFRPTYTLSNFFHSRIAFLLQ